MKAFPDIEERLRAHLAAERDAIKTPPGLEGRVLRRLERGTPPSRRLGMGRQLLVAAALIVLAVAVAFAIARLRFITPAPVGPSPTVTNSPTASLTPSPTPPPITSPRPPTAGEYADMVRAGNPGAEQHLGIPDCGGTSVGPGHDCFYALGSSSDAIVGTQAGYYHGARFGSGCWVYLYQDSAGWHFVDVRCAQAVGTLPRIGMDDIVNVSGCANVRSDPGLQGQVVGCLPNGTTVHVIGGPVYRDGKLWWQLQGGGWMVHDSLVT